MTDHSNRAHYTYGASSAHRWKVCHASTFATAGMEDEPSLYAKDGTEAHELLDFCLEIEARSAADFMWLSPSKLELGEDGLTKRANAVQVALDYVYGILDSNPDAVLVREQQYVFDNPYTTDSGGTVDVGIYIPSMNWLYVPDYKHGIGIVDIEDNAQTYMYGCELVLGPNAPFPEAEFITLAIIQPNAFGKPVKEILVTREALEIYAAETAQDIYANQRVIEKAELKLWFADAYVPGEKQCQWCRARQVCKPREEWYASKMGANFKSVAQIGEALPSVPEGVKLKDVAMLAAVDDTPEEVGRKMAAYEYIMEFCRDYIAAGEKRVRNMEKIPGWKLVETQRKSRWLGSLEPVQIAQHIMNVTGQSWDDVFPRKLVTITDAKAAVKAAIIAQGVPAKDAAKRMEDTLAQVIDKSSSGNLTVVPDTDARQAVTLTSTVEETFAGVHVIPQ